ncbi:MAG: radical SAM protein [Planctomycetota bacterium]
MSAGALARDLVAANLGGRRPFKLTLVLNYACNCRCAMCNIWQKSSRGEMTREEIDRFFTRSGHWSWINLSGGEILMKKEAEEIVALTVARNRRLWLLDFPTTGFRPERLEGLARIALDSGLGRLAITISLDGPPEVHEAVRRAPGLFDLAMESWARLRAIGDDRLLATFGMTLSAANVDQVEATVAAIRARHPEFERRDLHLNLAQTSEHYYDNAGMTELETEDHRARVLEAIRDHRARSGAEGLLARVERRFQRDLAEYCRTGRSAYSCRSLRASVFVDPFWNVFPCITWNRPLGNLRECDFELREILGGEAATDARRMIRERRCPDCWTACEALPTLLASAPRALWREIRGVEGGAERNET